MYGYVRVYPNNGFINRSARINTGTILYALQYVCNQRHFLEDFSRGNSQQATGKRIFVAGVPIVVCINLWLHPIWLIS